MAVFDESRPSKLTYSHAVYTALCQLLRINRLIAEHEALVGESLAGMAWLLGLLQFHLDELGLNPRGKA